MTDHASDDRALTPLPVLRVPPALERRAVAAATRALPSAWSHRLPDLALAAYCVGELVYALRVVHVLP